VGWMYGRRELGLSHKEYFQQRWGDGGVVLDAAGTHREVYLVVQPKGEDFRIGVAVDIHWCPNDAEANFGWKEASEDMGPTAVHCPERILNQLSPVEAIYGAGTESARTAQRWRDECVANRKARQRLRPGVRVRFDEPVRFKEESFQVMEIERLRPVRLRAVFMDGEREIVSGPYYTVSRHLLDEATIVEAEGEGPRAVTASG
jgi:hypothetical protein